MRTVKVLSFLTSARIQEMHQFLMSSDFMGLSFSQEHVARSRRTPSNGETVQEEGKPRYLEGNLFQCQFIRQKSHMDWCGGETQGA
jgi:hypothetical protein